MKSNEGPDRIYSAAEGTEIKELGTNTLQHAFQDDSIKQEKWKVAGVKEALMAVSAAVRAKNRVVFQPDEWGGKYLEDLTAGKPVVVKPRGKCKRIYEREGKYILPTW